ncbi:MAG: LysE family transporter [Candidatus Kapabacteria bacterium]|nr:LysE family transporter [Candidatus Kapabacteria bacterium]
MLHLLAGFITGFCLSIPPGPVAAVIVTTTIRNGRRAGYIASLGVTIADILFCFLASFASLGIIATFGSYITAHPVVSLLLQLLVAVAIIVFGYMQWKHRVPDMNSTMTSQENVSSRPFFTALLTALSNAINPTFLPTLAGMLTVVSSQLPESWNAAGDKALFTVGFGLGCYAWLTVIVEAVRKYHRGLSSSMMKWLFRIMGGILIAFGVVLLVRITLTLLIE